MHIACADLKYRGFRDDRLTSFEYKQRANFLLYRRVLDADVHEYELLRQSWDSTNRPKYTSRQWSTEQEQALKYVDQGVSYDDEEIKAASARWQYMQGPPGSGKTLVLLEMAIRCARKGLHVLIVCPTGTNVFVFKSQLPEFDGVERIAVDTIQGVLKYKRPGADSKVAWAPP